MTDFDRWFNIYGMYELPEYIVLLTLMIAVVFLWKKYPRVALASFLGLLIILLAEGFGSYIVKVWLNRQKPDANLFRFFYFLFPALNALGLVMLIWAAFGWRKPQPDGQYPPQPVYGMPYPPAVNYPPQYPPQPQYPQYPPQPGAYPNLPGGYPPPPPPDQPPAPRPYPPDEPTQVG